MTEKVDTAALVNELVLRRYRMSDGQLRQHFEGLNIPGYLALHIIADTASAETIYAGRTYLQDLADKMQVSVRQVSKLVGELRDRGLVQWAHDGNGDDGTYVVITEAGRRLMTDQEQVLKDYYGRVIDAYGKDNMIQLLRMMKQLDTVMSNEMEETEAERDADRTNL